jgi:hypothetical protein
MCVLIFCITFTGSQNSWVVLSSDESWVFKYNPETKRQSANWQWAVAHCKLFPSQESEIEQIENQTDAHLLFWQSGDQLQVICFTVQTVYHTFYQEILERLRKMVARVWLGIARSWMLHHNNAPCHTAVYINQSLADKSIPVVPHSSVCRVSVTVTYFYFPASKATWTGAILVPFIISRWA